MINILNDVKALINGGRKHHMSFVCWMIVEVQGNLSFHGDYLQKWIIKMIRKDTPIKTINCWVSRVKGSKYYDENVKNLWQIRIAMIDYMIKELMVEFKLN